MGVWANGTERPAGGEIRDARAPACSPGRGAIVSGMVPMALTGSIVVGVAASSAVLLLIVLLRREDRYDKAEVAAREQREAARRAREENP